MSNKLKEYCATEQKKMTSSNSNGITNCPWDQEWDQWTLNFNYSGKDPRNSCKRDYICRGQVLSSEVTWTNSYPNHFFFELKLTQPNQLYGLTIAVDVLRSTMDVQFYNNLFFGSTFKYVREKIQHNRENNGQNLIRKCICKKTNPILQIP